jgi:hypothetical protein
MFAFDGDRLVKATPFDVECRMLADRHYSRRIVGAKQFTYSGRKLILRNPAGTVLFVWMYPDEAMRMDGQAGANCALFRNESDRLSSEIILEAESWLPRKWPEVRRLYTYVDPSKVKSRNPGYCFKMAGWHLDGFGKDGKHRLVKFLSARTD